MPVHDSICAHSRHCRHGAHSQYLSQREGESTAQSVAGMSGRYAIGERGQNRLLFQVAEGCACSVSRILMLSATTPGIAAISADFRAMRCAALKGHSLGPCSCSTPSTTVALRSTAGCCSGAGACAAARGACAGATIGPGLAAGTAAGLLAALTPACASGDTPAYER